jgi:hypothetical protein
MFFDNSYGFSSVCYARLRSTEVWCHLTEARLELGLSNSSSWERSMRATFFIGSRRLRKARSVQ